VGHKSAQLSHAYERKIPAGALSLSLSLGEMKIFQAGARYEYHEIIEEEQRAQPAGNTRMDE
jgi:hypothetical protein